MVRKPAEKIVCETPTPGKKPTRIDYWKYHAISEAILDVLPMSGEGIAFKELSELVSEKLDNDIKEKIGSIGWHTTTVKLDLECKKRIARIKGVSPQRLIRVCE